MPGLLKLLTAAVLGLALAAAPVAAQDIHIEPIPPQVKPQWTPVPNVPGVFYAPNIPTDVFRHGSKYYFYWEGYLYRGSKPRGPWKSVKQPPDWFSAIDPALFKTVKKEGAPAPPAPPAGRRGRAHRGHNPHPVGPGPTGNGPAAATAGPRKRRGASRARPAPQSDVSSASSSIARDRYFSTDSWLLTTDHKLARMKIPPSPPFSKGGFKVPL